MKRLIISLAIISSVTLSSVAQNVSVAEPEFIHGCIHLTSDSTYKKLPKELAQIKKHESKMAKFAKIGGAIADAASTVGVGMIGLGGSVSSGLQTVAAASTVSSAAGTLDMLGGIVGMDIVFDGNQSPYVVPAGENVRIIYREENNDIDPMELMRVVKFKKSKKDRRIQWLEISPAVLGSEKATKSGFVNFDGGKYGENSYLITIPSEELEKGEYGIVMGSGAISTEIPVVTFSVQ